MSLSYEQFSQTFKVVNRGMILLWRLGLGRWVNIWPEVGGRIMVLGHIGRRSGLRRLTPVNYAPVGGEIYLMSAWGERSDWYRNIVDCPQVEVWLPDGWWEGTVEQVPPDDPRRIELTRALLIASGFAAPLFAGLHPHRMTDDQLAFLTSEYHLLHVRRTRPLTRSSAPGDLVWVWPLVGIIAAALLLRPRRRRRNRG